MDRRYSVLYAEDDEEVRKNHVLYFKNFFHDIYEAKDGKEALKKYKEKKPDVLILDVSMPEMNGLDLAKNIRKNDSHIPIIMISAHSNKEFLLEAIKLNLIDYLIKPVDSKELKKLLEIALEKVENNLHLNEDPKIIISKSCYWDTSKKLFFYRNKIVDLTNNEKNLFELLLDKKNQVVKPVEISSYIWANDNKVNDASIRNLVKRLRKKLPVDIIQSIYGSGYILNF